MSRNKFSDLSKQKDNMYFGTEAVNRVSFLREDNEFITNAVLHKSTRFVFLDETNPLVNKASENRLIRLTNGDNQLADDEGDVKKGLYEEGGEWAAILDAWASDNKDQDQGLRDEGKPTLLFLGLYDKSVGLDLTKLKATRETTDECYLDHQGRYQGIPYFAVDVTGLPKVSELVTKHILANSSIDAETLFYSRSFKHYFGFNETEASLYSHAKMFLDWLSRNRFCPGCGLKVIPIHAGGKLKCINDEQYKRYSRTHEKEMDYFRCPVKNKKVLNVSFPRTDAVIITAITNREHTKILLSLGKRHAFTNMYSCTAGFMEPSETVEVATKREIWEETGVTCSKIDIIMTQPWPFPANLMIGCIGTVDFNGTNEVIHLGHDRELADARWFDIEEVRKIIYEPEAEESNPSGILLPGPESISFSLIRMVVDNSKTKL